MGDASRTVGYNVLKVTVGHYCLTTDIVITEATVNGVVIDSTSTPISIDAPNKLITWGSTDINDAGVYTIVVTGTISRDTVAD